MAFCVTIFDETLPGEQTASLRLDLLSSTITARADLMPGLRDKGTGELFLPAAGDRMLAIILSKAFGLTDDTKIKDEFISSCLSIRQQTPQYTLFTEAKTTIIL